ncbi:HD domain-containing protein [Fulvivirga sp. M361]|uniref:Pycsar system effector family protein n=1 Tax=Fulvivirga sp. M361 TaxID=2594266 RepID=UPI00117B5CC6|nr:Pycsar system effector family protein [Fulvivirga sp. M361]TRX60537.1 HD domain-containing protein [Fulvivirga sp. M361]
MSDKTSTSNELDLDIVEEAKSFVKKLLQNKTSGQWLFHNYNHAKDVAEVAVELGGMARLEESELEVLELAAWFHDTGYVKCREGHETESVTIAKEFLNERHYDKEKIEQVSQLILSTDIKKEASSLLEEILHDADLSHLGRKRFFRIGELLRAELEAIENKEFTELEWQKKQYDFLINNTFITTYAQKAFGSRRNKNILKQRDNILDAEKITRRLQTGKDFGRGIDTLYRSNYRNHINFSAIADGKANMMISINTILISVIVTLSGASFSVFEGLQLESLRFTIPIFTLLLGSLVSVFFAVMSARPKVTEKKVTRKKMKRKDMTLLYFGNFLEVSQEEFTRHLTELKNNQKELYDSMSKDIYNLGLVLKEKYRLLSISYTAFIIGITLCVIGFLSIFLITNLQ